MVCNQEGLEVTLVGEAVYDLVNLFSDFLK